MDEFGALVFVGEIGHDEAEEAAGLEELRVYAGEEVVLAVFHEAVFAAEVDDLEGGGYWQHSKSVWKVLVIEAECLVCDE